MYPHDIVTDNVTTSPNVTPSGNLILHEFQVADVTTSPSVTHVDAFRPIVTVADVTVQTNVTHPVLESRNTEAADVTLQPNVTTTDGMYNHDLLVADATAQPAVTTATPALAGGPLSVADVTAQPNATTATVMNFQLEVADVTAQPGVTHVDAYPSTIPAGTLHLWHFDGNLTDYGLRGDDWNAVPAGSTLSAGKFGSAYSMPDDPVGGAKAELTTPLDSSSESWTVEGWALADQWESSRVMFYIENAAWQRTVNISFGLNGSDQVTSTISALGENGISTYGTATLTQVPAEMHWAVTWDHLTQTVEIFINGGREATEVRTDGMRDVARLVLGWPNVDFAQVAKADEVRISAGVVYSGTTYTVPTEPFEPQVGNHIQARNPYLRPSITSATLEQKPTVAVQDVTLQTAVTPLGAYSAATVALWHLNGNFDAAVGDNAWGGEVYEYAPGRFGQGLDPVTGTGFSYGNFSSIDLDSDDCTIEFFLTVPEGKSAGTIIMRTTASGGGVGLTSLYLQQFSSGGLTRLILNSYGSTPLVSLDTGYVLSESAPIHVAIVSNSTEVMLFANGTKYGSHTKGTGYRPFACVSFTAHTTSLRGLVYDEVRISNAAIYSGTSLTVPTEQFAPNDGKNYLVARRPTAQPFSSQDFGYLWLKSAIKHIYHFDGNGTDSAGSANFTLDGTQTYNTGKWGQALELEGADYTEPHSWANTTDLNPHTTDFTFECWSNLLASSVQTYIDILRFADVEDGYGGVEDRMAMHLCWSGNSGSRRPVLRIKQVSGTTTTLYGDYVSLASYPTVFHHFAVVCRSSAEKIDYYVNGTREGSLDFSALSLRTMKSLNTRGLFDAQGTQTDEAVISTRAVYPDSATITVPPWPWSV
jgi:hypothetical protein